MRSEGRGSTTGHQGTAEDGKLWARRRVAERRKTKQPAVLGGVIAVAVVGGAFGAYSLYGSGAAAEDGITATTRKAVRTGPLSAAEVSMASTAFLTAWQSGDVTRAARRPTTRPPPRPC